MKRKLYLQMVAISIVVMIVTMIITASMFYRLFIGQVLADLKTDINIMMSTDSAVEYVQTNYDPDIDNLRITIIDTSGEVVFDSNTEIGGMDNHNDRPEVQSAFETGSGQSIRKSNTVQKSTFYYAEKMENGQVLRLAKEVGSLWQFCLGIMPVLIVELIIAIIVCVGVSRVMSRKIVKPIEMMARNLDNDETQVGYEEIQPFLDKIHSQHKDLKRSAAVRQEFTANVSHELKTPLASISGYAELIETGMAKDEDVRRFAGEIHKSSKRLLSLINDIIELSQLDVMNHKMEIYPVSLNEEVERIVESLQVNASQRQITIETSHIEENCIIEANQQMLEELICNLCDNAIRYNKPNGHVWVSVLKEKDNIVLQIKDDGIGISIEDQERIFERFYRVDKARSKKTGGTGLGLAIVKHIAEQHNAEIRLESELDKGTIISLVFKDKYL